MWRPGPDLARGVERQVSCHQGPESYTVVKLEALAMLFAGHKGNLGVPSCRMSELLCLGQPKRIDDPMGLDSQQG
jgi:hypothetical protein